jgi:arginine/lysine/ornithine decarboxylase
VSALAQIESRFSREKTGMLSQEYLEPTVVCAPQDAFYAEKESLPLKSAVGRICTEFVMCYPPGIPVLAPGEMVTKDIVEYISYAKEKGCSLTGSEDLAVERLNVMKI